MIRSMTTYGLIVFFLWVVVGFAGEEKVPPTSEESAVENWPKILLPVGDSLSFTVNRALSGDTLELSTGKQLRLVGVVAPKPSNGKDPADYFAAESRDFVNNLVRGKEVTVTFGKRKTDAKGRWLGYVWLSDGDFLNYRVLSEGYGFFDPHSAVLKEYRKDFEQAEEEARTDHVGIWKNTGRASEVAQRVRQQTGSPPPEVPYYNPKDSYVPKRDQKTKRNQSGNKAQRKRQVRIIPGRVVPVPPTNNYYSPYGYGSGSTRHPVPGNLRSRRQRDRRFGAYLNPYFYNNGTFIGLTPVTAPTKSSGVQATLPKTGSVKIGTGQE